MKRSHVRRPRLFFLSLRSWFVFVICGQRVLVFAGEIHGNSRDDYDNQNIQFYTGHHHARSARLLCGQRKMWTVCTSTTWTSNVSSQCCTAFAICFILELSTYNCICTTVFIMHASKDSSEPLLASAQFSPLCVVLCSCMFFYSLVKWALTCVRSKAFHSDCKYYRAVSVTKSDFLGFQARSVSCSSTTILAKVLVLSQNGGLFFFLLTKAFILWSFLARWTGWMNGGYL